jgi:hypothetical protein
VVPVVFAEAEPWQSETPYALRVTEQGLRHPVFEITGDRVKDAALWQGAPPLLGSSLIQRAKRGADILAVQPKVLVDGKPMPVVIVQRYGAGKSMVLTADTTWRWSRFTRVLGQSDTLFARFWSQAVRWLAGREADDEQPVLALATDRPDYEVGKPVTLTVRQGEVKEPDAAGATLRVDVTDEEGRETPVALETSSGEPGVHTGTVYPSAGGRYRVTASLVAQGRTLANQATEFLVYGSGLELADQRVDRDRLHAIALATGGLYYDLDEAPDLVAQLRPEPRRTVRVERTELWDSPWLFIFFLAAITTEWVFRRRNHLV